MSGGRPLASTIRATDLVTARPLADADVVIDLGDTPIPGLFFPSAELARDARSRVRMVRSRSSGLYQLDRDLNPELYVHFQSGHATPAHLDHLERTADEIAGELPLDARILEIGGGAGHLMRALARRGFRHLYVVDPSPANQSNGEYEVFRSLFPGDLEQQPIRFDLIVSQHFLEHSAAPVAALRASKALLRPGGRVWVEVPDLRRTALEDGGVWLRVIYALHSAYFDRATLTLAAAHAGLGLVRSLDVEHYGKSLVSIFESRPGAGAGPEPSDHAPDDASAEVTSAIRRYFAALADFGRTLPSGLLCWGASEGCVTVLGALMAAGFRPGGICDSNPALRGLFVSGMAHPVLAPADLTAPITDVMIHTLGNAEAIVRANPGLFARDANVYIPFVGRRGINQLSG